MKLLVTLKLPEMSSSERNLLQPAVHPANRASSCAKGNSVAGSETRRIFLLSPASVAGIRARLVTQESADSDMARRLRRGGVSLGELFSFISGLYFRGKLAYARAFSDAPPDVGGAFIITSSGGLVSPDTLITLERLREISSGNLDPADARYRTPLDRDAQSLAEISGTCCQIVLLGSIATAKYVDPLVAVFGRRLVFPAEFVGRGDMSRGGLMLRCVQSGEQLTYVPVLGATRHGRKPPKLAPHARKVPSGVACALSGLPEKTSR
ncbi:MAG TPA: hypothetical protein VEI01_00465 [Terriglobales bacterium]|nr:hypothetical protein [Terriglobales bacterium]